MPKRNDDTPVPPASDSPDTAPEPGGSSPRIRRTTLAAGEVVDDRYRVIRFIAHGGMGEVYEVEDQLIRERVALKMMRPGSARDAGATERFRREILLARKVTHPNICRIFDAGVHEGLPFLTMELLSGESLHRALARVGRLPPAEALPIVGQMAAALAAAHKAGVVHRDFKSANVVLVPAEEGGLRAVVTDFGVARWMGSDGTESSFATGTGVIVGTPAYMAPEQVEGGDITGAADIYAFGVVIYEMVTGTVPFKGDSPLATATRRLKQPPPSPRTQVPDLDPRWEATILRCLELSPGSRFAGAMEVASALTGPAPADPRRDEAERRSAAEAADQRRRLWTRALAAGGTFLILFAGAYLVVARLLHEAPPAPVDAQVSELPGPGPGPGPTVNAGPPDAAAIHRVEPPRDGIDRHLAEAKDATQAEQWAKVIEIAEAADEIEPGNPEIAKYRAQALIEERSQTGYDALGKALRDGRFGEAEAALRRIDPESVRRDQAQESFAKAREEWLGRQVAEARQIAVRPDCTPARIAAVAAKVKNTWPGQEDAVRGIKCTPDSGPESPDPNPGMPPPAADFDTLKGEAIAAARNGLFKQALSKAESALDLKPGDPEMISTAGVAACYLKREDLARKYAARSTGQRRNLLIQVCAKQGISVTLPE